MSGIPPFAGFFSKWLVFFSVIEKNNIYILLLVISSTFLITFSCLKIIKIMYFETSDFQFKVKKNTQLKFIMFLCLIINIFMFIVISPLVDAIVNVSNSIF
jgi:NADH-quinone oxidoreductase subunit N